ncbi:MAG TPA: hypothetical protein V6D31_10430 [Candidatus Sericytochromatia bacterium]
MPDYFHSALKGDQIHEAKIKVLPAGSSFPVPEWEGQLLVVGVNLYCSIRQNQSLNWIQPPAGNQPQLPPDVVKLETGTENPPLSRTGNGIIYQNFQIRKIWYLANNSWLELGIASSSANFEVIPLRAPENWQGNFFGLLNSENGLENCLLITKWQSNKKYYIGVKTPLVSGLNVTATDDNKFYLELWRNNEILTISQHAQNTESLTCLDTFLFTSNFTEFRLGAYCLINQNKRYLNFVFDFESRLIFPQSFAQISYGY